MKDNTSFQTVTAIIPQKKASRLPAGKAGRVNVYLDDKFWKGLDQEVVVLLGLKKGKAVSPADLEKVVFEEEKKKAFAKALRLLEHRARSRREIEDRLHRASYDEEIIRSAVAQLLRLGYLNDEDFIKMWIKDRARKGYGEWRIVPELIAKGIERDLVEEEISRVYDEGKRRERALEVGQKKLSTLSKEEENKRYKKLNQYLLRRGFSSSMVTEVCQELMWQEGD